MTGEPSPKLSAVDPLIGRTINDRFKITTLLARGGMGKVYLAEQLPLGRQCAIKVLNPGYAGDQDPEFQKRFFLEASIASKLTHPNTVTIFDYGKTDDDIYYIAMEYLEGVTVHRAIKLAGHLPEARVAHIAMQICRALREAHSLGVIHRDLKPANIFLVKHGDENDFVKLLDFGLVKEVGDTKAEEQLTQTGLFMGSPKYMAPEQIRGDRVDARTDIYSLGIIMYEMLCGKVPFDRPNSLNTLMAHVNDEAPSMHALNPNANIGMAMEQTVARCMSKDPERRFRSMDEVLQALKELAGLGQSALGAGASGAYALASGQYPSPGSALGTGSFTPSGQPIPAVLAPPPAPSNGTPLGVHTPTMQVVTRKPRVAAMLVLGLTALIAGGATVLLTHDDSARTHVSGAASGGVHLSSAPPGPNSGAAASAGGASAATTSQSAAAAATVRIDTDPDGAVVREDGKELCSATPCDVVFRGDDEKRDHKLVIVKAGFRTETREVKEGDPPVTVRLSRIPFAPAPPPRREPTDKDNGKTPQGFKEIPY